MDNTTTMLLKAAEAHEKAFLIMKDCKDADDVRKGFGMIANLMREIPGQETLVSSLEAGSRRFDVDYSEAMRAREKIMQSAQSQAAALRETARALGKKWWQFWK